MHLFFRAAACGLLALACAGLAGCVGADPAVQYGPSLPTAAAVSAAGQKAVATAEATRDTICRYTPAAKAVYQIAVITGKVKASAQARFVQAFRSVDAGCATPPGSDILVVVATMVSAWSVISDQSAAVAPPVNVLLRRPVRVAEAH